MFNRTHRTPYHAHQKNTFNTLTEEETSLTESILVVTPVTERTPMHTRSKNLLYYIQNDEGYDEQEYASHKPRPRQLQNAIATAYGITAQNVETNQGNNNENKTSKQKTCWNTHAHANPTVKTRHPTIIEAD